MSDPSVVPFPVPSRRDSGNTFVAQSLPMRQLLVEIERIAASSIPVLILGETGSGKEVIARAVHKASGRKGGFVALNCAALPTSLVESELFGHVHGAFTGAVDARPGAFQEADGGTLLLDEVGELEPINQAKLLRVLEDGSVRPVGASRTHSVDARVIFSTHRSLVAEVEAGRFRDDLYYRIAGAILRVPPLRDHPEDILPLVVRFFSEASGSGSTPSLAEGTREWLLDQRWRGNVRELKLACQRAALSGKAFLRPEDFALIEPVPESHGAVPEAWLLHKTWEEIEREILRWALARYGSRRAAAQALHRPSSTVADRVRCLGIDNRSPAVASHAGRSSRVRTSTGER